MDASVEAIRPFLVATMERPVLAIKLNNCLRCRGVPPWAPAFLRYKPLRSQQGRPRGTNL